MISKSFGSLANSKHCNPLKDRTKKKKKRAVEAEDIYNIARLYFIEYLPVTEIAKKFGVSRGTMSGIVRAGTYPTDWAMACGDLILEGYTLDRYDLDAKSVKKRAKKYNFTVEQIKDIRRRLENKETAISISREFGVKRGVIERIKSGEQYGGPEYR